MVKRFSALLAVFLIVAACAPAKVYLTPESAEPVREDFVQSAGVRLDAFAISVKTAISVAGIAASHQELDLDLYETVLDKGEDVSAALVVVADALAQYEATQDPASAATVDEYFAIAEIALAAVLEIAEPFMSEEEGSP